MAYVLKHFFIIFFKKNTNIIIIDASYDRTIRNYVKGLENPKVQNLSELIQFNKDHSDQELLPSKIFFNSLKYKD